MIGFEEVELLEIEEVDVLKQERVPTVNLDWRTVQPCI